LLQVRINGIVASPDTRKDTIFVGRSNALQIRLVDDVRYFWLMIIPETTATELHELDEDIAKFLWAMTRHLGEAIKTHCKPPKATLRPLGSATKSARLATIQSWLGRM